MWAVKHKSGTVLFVTNCERTANNRREMGWIVEDVKMTSREQFEKWIGDGVSSDLHRQIMLSRYENGNYSHTATRHKWDAWQASRAAIEIEAQTPLTTRDALNVGYSADYATGVEHGIRAMEQAIEQAGLKVK